MDTEHCVVDGWVGGRPVPGPCGTATFDLVVRPADPDAVDGGAPDTVVTCAGGGLRVTHGLLSGIQAGGLLRVTGALVEPPARGEPVRLTVDALEVLDSGLFPVLRGMVRDRYGDCCVIFGADREKVPVFTGLGQWVGEAGNPDAVAALIGIHERVSGGDA
ncbi:hypothetical protein [Streptomyces sp. NPDC095613]|uniref:hypothetical protein n=1 Tax=Streptomyces sp. NPDC095613 TaxID=3155540 RepID=UPI0033168958